MGSILIAMIVQVAYETYGEGIDEIGYREDWRYGILVKRQVGLVSGLGWE